MARRNPPWNRRELILALELYLQHRGHPPSKESDEVTALSDTLRQLGVHPPDEVGDDFRNCNSVYMKLSNFLHIDPEHPGSGLRAVGEADRLVWDEFARDPAALRREADTIRLRLIR